MHRAVLLFGTLLLAGCSTGTFRSALQQVFIDNTPYQVQAAYDTCVFRAVEATKAREQDLPVPVRSLLHMDHKATAETSCQPILDTCATDETSLECQDMLKPYQ
jgi:hypothetical protein